jgi:hypothetical protein
MGVQRVVDEQGTHRPTMGLMAFIAFGAHDHALRDGVAQVGTGLSARPL